MDGWPQIAYISKEESSSPAVSLELFFISCAMDAIEGQKVATVDIPDDFIQIDQEGTASVKLTGVMVQLLLNINPGKYEKHIRWFRVEEVLYAGLKKSLHRTLLRAMLFWNKLTEFIVKNMGFKIKLYDWCVAKKSSTANNVPSSGTWTI